ncbi:MAG: ASPIC/UnbV domain-containing protein [Planctomycetota bacterium]
MHPGAVPRAAPITGAGQGHKPQVGKHKLWHSEGRQIRVLDAGCHYLSTSELVLTFGLGDAKLVDVLKVYWNDRTGATTTLRAVAVDQEITIKSY